MVVIKGYEFNMTQIGHNKYLNHITSGKEAQKLAELIRGLDEEITVVNRSRDGLRSETLVFNRTPIYCREDGATAKYVEFTYQEDVTADSAFLDNWSKSTGTAIQHSLTFTSDPSVPYINSSTIDHSSIKYHTHYVKGSTTKNASVKDPSVVGMDQSEFLSYVRENGLDKDINWNEVGGYLKADAGFSTISGFTDYAGAMYAGLEQRITKDFSGEEQAVQLKKLNECFNTAVQEYANSYEEQLTTVYNEFGVNLDEFKIKASVTSLFAEKRDSYREFAKQNTDYAKLSQSEDKWLERDVKFMTNALRNAHSPAEAETSLYSENDLKTLGYMASQHSKEVNFEGMSYVGARMNEESLGLALSMKYLSAESVTNEWGASDEVKNIISDITDSYSERIIDTTDSYLSAKGIDTNEPEKYRPLDREVIEEIIDKAKHSYKISGDTGKALKDCADFAYKLYTKSKSDPEKSDYARYNIPTDEPEVNFWHEFYDDGRGTSYLGKAIDKWNDFTTAIKNENHGFLKMIDNSYFFKYKTLLGGLYNKYLL